MLKKIDRWLNNIIMYRLVSYGLTLIAVTAIVFGFGHVLPYGGMPLLASLIIAVGGCYVFNWSLAKIWRAPANTESSIITGLILFLIMAPVADMSDASWLLIAAAIAMLSKYAIAWRHKHLFNPVAISAVIMGLVTPYPPLWWVATAVLFPLTLIIGLLIVRKIRREHIFFPALAVGLAVALIYAVSRNVNLLITVKQYFLSGPMIFFASVMLTEPLTMPARKRCQIIYGALAGLLANCQFAWGALYAGPELALMIDNAMAFATGQKRRLRLILASKTLIARDTYEYCFSLNHQFTWLPGQYVEITLPHQQADSRSVRRYFTIASAPSEQLIKFGIKFYQPGSSFKKQLLELPIGKKIMAGQVSGDFVLPADKRQSLIFIAGGIGVTPFSSMIKHLMDTGDRRRIILFYANRTCADIAYRDLFEQAKAKLDFQVVYAVNDLEAGQSRDCSIIDSEVIKKFAPDFASSLIYISGPSGMVDDFKVMFKGMGAPAGKIKTDYFPGFA